VRRATLLGLLLLAGGSLLAQPADRRQELADLKKRLTTLKARYAGTKKREADLKQALASAELNLQIQTAERRVLELSYGEVEKAAGQATADRDQAATLATRLRDDLALRISALYRMGRLGYLRTLVVAESGRTFLRGLQVLTHLARKDSELLQSYQHALQDLSSREKDLSDRRHELAQLADQSRLKETELALARAEKARLLAQATRSAEEEKVQVATLEDKSSRLASLLDLLENQGKATAPGAASVRKFRGVLDWPAKGKLVVPFGRIANPKFPKTFLRSSGWTLDTPPGTAVHAVFAGEVVYSQWLKGYGNLVVLDHGDGIFSLYGRLATGSTVARGQKVALGDQVGVLGPSPEEEVAGLYFEIREDRTSVDPRQWLR
jgi:septal ring factor EnvC (AmiA/AmiB activator)